MTVAVKLDSCAFYVRIWLFFRCLDRIIPSLLKMIHPRTINEDMGQSFCLFLKPLEMFSCQQSSPRTLDEGCPFFSSIIIVAFLLLSFWSLLALTNAVNTSSSCCISLRIWDRLLVLFLEHESLYFSPFDTTSPFESSSFFVIKPRQNTWNPYCNTPFAFFFISEPKKKANDSKESKKTLRTENWPKIT